MNKKLIIILLLGVFTFSLNAQKLSFKKDGTFKIVQFTDMHYKHGDPKSDTTLMLIPRILDTEKPDMVIFTGDIVTGAVQEGWDAVTKFVIDRKIPFAVTLGNHDHEQGVTREEIADIVTSYPFNINRLSEISHGRVMDNVIPVYSSLKPLWYREQSIHYTVKNNFHPLPALAYFHIPLPEYKLAFDDEKNIRYGERKEDECPPGLNSGMFFSMKEMGDIMGTFVGHDHVNDYIVNYHGIALTYGHFSGWKTTYTPEINGARIVVLKEGKREFDTWLHQLDGNIKHKVSYPSQLLNPAK